MKKGSAVLAALALAASLCVFGGTASAQPFHYESTTCSTPGAGSGTWGDVLAACIGPIRAEGGRFAFDVTVTKAHGEDFSSSGTVSVIFTDSKGDARKATLGHVDSLGHSGISFRAAFDPSWGDSVEMIIEFVSDVGGDARTGPVTIYRVYLA